MTLFLCSNLNYTNKKLCNEIISLHSKKYRAKYYIVYLSRPSDGYFYVFVDASYCVYHEETNVACAMP